ncbi:hypothetical protein PTQ27_09495 [Mannheimia sp. AT1]|uniref:Uncharacterized protein n=1 Tax=Mannheimia cairinae TaxID=3025936 RepID=A0ABT5MUW9_9PAST|nr:hypothetical protein [Mannheimia cairinae]MDD0824692.1 hypothetical protein [Mannheimia cairinae]MDD0826379.1 hypothetical protein [Mannheimia cairinae]
MNKLYVALILALTANYSLAAAEKKANEPKPFDGKPTVGLHVFDTSTKVAKPISGNTLSISKKQNRLCWSSINVPLQNKVTIAEAFYAPDVLKIISEGSKVDSSADKKQHTIVSEITNVNTENLNRCWDFDKTDPIGKYQMEIQINDIIFKGLEFEIVK